MIPGRNDRNSFQRCWKLCFLLTIAVVLQNCGGRSTTKLPSIFYPPLPQKPRIQFLTRYQNSKDLGVKVSSFQKFITGQTEKTDILNKPHSAIYDKGKLYICDSRRGDVVIMDLKQKKLYSLGENESFVFGKPLSIAISDDGVKYVADNIRKRVYVFDKNDKFVETIGEDGQFGPTSVAVFQNKLFVADIQDHEVEILNRFTGEVLSTFGGSEESETGPFLMPANLTVDYEGKLYVSDLLAGNIQVFDSSLNFIRNIGRLGDTFGCFARPRGVAVDSAGYIYVVDAAFENVQIFTPEGELALYFGGPTVSPGGMYLPSGVTISYSDLEVFAQYVDKRFIMKYIVVVANQYGPNGVSIYAFGQGEKSYFEKLTLQPENKTSDTSDSSAASQNQ